MWNLSWLPDDAFEKRDHEGITKDRKISRSDVMLWLKAVLRFCDSIETNMWTTLIKWGREREREEGEEDQENISPTWFESTIWKN